MRKRAILAALGSSMLLSAPAASANGPCGQNFDGNHACGVNSPANILGSLTTDNESDYYRFHAVKGTQISVSMTDTEDPRCSTNDSGSCGYVSVALDDAQGNNVDGTDSSRPSQGITVPRTFSHTIDVKGTYYLIVSGNLGQDANSNPTAVPYTLNVSASPAVVWPAPAPIHKKVCQTRKVRRRIHHRWRTVKVKTCKTYTIYP